MFLKEKMEALAGLRPGLIGEVAKIPGSRILDGQFSAVQQAVGTPKKNVAGAAYIKQFVEDAKKSGAVASLIQKHGVVGRLSVAPLV
jgi:polar amino acid transport system substrate-binding protein